MLDGVIVKHLDMMDILEESIEKDFDDILDAIDIDLIIDNPQQALRMAAEDMQNLLIEKYYTIAAENGIKFARDIIKDGDVKIEKTDDPNLNEGKI